MEQQHQQTLTNLVYAIYEDPTKIEEHHVLIQPLLSDLVASSPAGLLKLKTYLQKINL